MSLLDVCQRLETTALAIAIQQSAYGFVIAVAIHILGLAASVGILLWVDLRLVGVALTRRPLDEVYKNLAPWFGAGFVVTLLSGFALFTAFATAAYGNVFFRIKLALLLVAGLNALLFHRFAARHAEPRADFGPPPAAARIAGALSLAIWAAVIVMGRTMSYTMF